MSTSVDSDTGKVSISGTCQANITGSNSFLFFYFFVSLKKGPQKAIMSTANHIIFYP